MRVKKNENAKKISGWVSVIRDQYVRSEKKIENWFLTETGGMEVEESCGYCGVANSVKWCGKDPDDMPQRPERAPQSPRVNTRKPPSGRTSRCGACSDTSFLPFPEGDPPSVASTHQPRLPLSDPVNHGGTRRRPLQPTSPCETRFTRELPHVQHSASPYDIRLNTALVTSGFGTLLRGRGTYYRALAQRSSLAHGLASMSN